MGNVGLFFIILLFTFQLYSPFYVYEISKKLGNAEEVLKAMSYQPLANASSQDTQELRIDGEVDLNRVAKAAADLVILQCDLELLKGCARVIAGDRPSLQVRISDVLEARHMQGQIYTDTYDKAIELASRRFHGDRVYLQGKDGGIKYPPNMKQVYDSRTDNGAQYERRRGSEPLLDRQSADLTLTPTNGRSRVPPNTLGVEGSPLGRVTSLPNERSCEAEKVHGALPQRPSPARRRESSECSFHSLDSSMSISYTQNNFPRPDPNDLPPPVISDEDGFNQVQYLSDPSYDGSRVGLHVNASSTLDDCFSPINTFSPDDQQSRYLRRPSGNREMEVDRVGGDPAVMNILKTVNDQKMAEWQSGHGDMRAGNWAYSGDGNVNNKVPYGDGINAGVPSHTTGRDHQMHCGDTERQSHTTDRGYYENTQMPLHTAGRNHQVHYENTEITATDRDHQMHHGDTYTEMSPHATGRDHQVHHGDTYTEMPHATGRDHQVHHGDTYTEMSPHATGRDHQMHHGDTYTEMSPHATGRDHQVHHGDTYTEMPSHATGRNHQMQFGDSEMLSHKTDGSSPYLSAKSEQPHSSDSTIAKSEQPRSSDSAIAKSEQPHSSDSEGQSRIGSHTGDSTKRPHDTAANSDSSSIVHTVPVTGNSQTAPLLTSTPEKSPVPGRSNRTAEHIPEGQEDDSCPAQKRSRSDHISEQTLEDYKRTLESEKADSAVSDSLTEESNLDHCAREKQVSEPHTWICDYCTYINASNNPTCDICGIPHTKPK